MALGRAGELQVFDAKVGRLAGFEQSGGIVKLFSALVVKIDKPNQKCGAADVRVQLLHDLQILWNETRF